jgi:DNA-directed RNA polymerase subunit M/transcription elongation factor TFIIS
MFDKDKNIERAVDALERIAKAQEKRSRTDSDGMILAKDFTSMIQAMVIGQPPTIKVDVPADPTDDTYALGIECPNCNREGRANIDVEIRGDGEDEQAFWVCKECHHAWVIPDEAEDPGPTAAPQV